MWVCLNSYFKIPSVALRSIRSNHLCIKTPFNHIFLKKNIVRLEGVKKAKLEPILHFQYKNFLRFIIYNESRFERKFFFFKYSF